MTIQEATQAETELATIKSELREATNYYQATGDRSRVNALLDRRRTAEATLSAARNTEEYRDFQELRQLEAEYSRELTAWAPRDRGSEQYARYQERQRLARDALARSSWNPSSNYEDAVFLARIKEPERTLTEAQRAASKKPQFRTERVSILSAARDKQDAPVVESKEPGAYMIETPEGKKYRVANTPDAKAWAVARFGVDFKRKLAKVKVDVSTAVVEPRRPVRPPMAVATP